MYTALPLRLYMFTYGILEFTETRMFKMTIVGLKHSHVMVQKTVSYWSKTQERKHSKNDKNCYYTND